MPAPRLLELVLVRQRRVFALVALVAFVLAGIVTFALPKIYRADATLFVGANRSAAEGADAQLDDQLARTYVSLLRTPAVTDAVARSVPFVGDGAALDDKVDIEVTSGTRLIRLSVSDRSPGRARRIADAYARTFVEQQRDASAGATASQLDALRKRIGELAQEIRRLRPSDRPADVSRRAVAETELRTARDAFVANGRGLTAQGSNVTVASPARRPTSPDRPRPKAYLAVGLLLALALGAAAAALRHRFDDRMRDEGALEALLGAPVLARIPTEPLGGPDDAVREACDLLCTNLRAGTADGRRRVIAVTSALPEEGKTFVARRVAAGFARMGMSVLAVDCDLRERTLSKQLGHDASRGVANLLVEPARDPHAVLVDTPMLGVHLLAAGPATPNPGAMLAMDRLSEVLADLAVRYSPVVVDSAPVTVGADTTALAGAVDGVVLVVDLRVAGRRALTDAVARLARAGTPVLGVALNRVRREIAHGAASASGAGAAPAPRPLAGERSA